MADEPVHKRREAVAAASKSLRELLDLPRAEELLAREDALPSVDGYRAELAEAWEHEGADGLRVEKRLRMLEIAARDLNGEIALPEVGRALSDLADAAIQVALAGVAPDAPFAIVSMGKLGGRELNYSSDIDLMFIAEGDQRAAARIGSDLIEVLGAPSPKGQAFRVDMNLRPEGRNGPLVRSLDSYLEYYRRWAHTWEFQALIKARFSAGDAELGARFETETRAVVYPAEVSQEGIVNIRKMKERVEEHAQRSARKGRSSEEDDVKLGPGGIRDIEFSVQLLQLVHGGADPSVRARGTLDAIAALTTGGYIADEDGAGLSVDYAWLRSIEHRIQLWQERQVHTLPPEEEHRTRIARSMGFVDTPAAGAAARFDEAHRRVLADVRGRFEKLFYRPMVEALADPSGVHMSQDALRERLRVLGFRDVDRATRTLSDLVTGTSRRAKLLRVLTPAMLRFLASSPLPDEGLFGFLRVAEALEGRVDSLGALRDNPPGIDFLARVLGSGRLLGDLLTHVPEEVATIADPRGPGGAKSYERLAREATASLGWRGPEGRLAGLRRFKRREMLRIALADVAREVHVEDVGAWLSDLADACLQAALGEIDVPFAVIAMGKLGGRELNYSSDIDVMFVHEGDQREAERLAEELLRAIGEVTPEGQAFRVDAALRPEGRAGVLARPLESYVEYYRRWGQTWEHQALIKARFSTGDAQLGERFLDAVRVFPFGTPPDQAAVGEIRHLKARMEKERIPRGTDPRRHLKLGPGGLSDVEFSTQLLQLEHGHAHPSLRTPNTMLALRSALHEELLSHEDHARLRDAYLFLSALRNRLFFVHARPVDTLPAKPEELEALGIAMGYQDQPRQELEESFLRVTRRCRQVAERLIYG